MSIKPPFLVQRPAWVKNDQADDHVVYYNNIEAILKRWKHPYKVTSNIKSIPDHNGILLAFHSICTRQNLWNLKKGYVPLYMNFDRFGFSGWSEMAKSKHLFELSQQVDKDEATKYVNSFRKKYEASNVSKYPQSPESINFDQPFLFVACQRPLDIVSDLARIQTYKLAEMVAQTLHTKINIVIKLHPKEIESSVISHLKKLPNVHFSNASIHKLIPQSAGVITVNSGAGFESLLYGKHVFTAGEVDYQWVTHPIHNKEDIINIPNVIASPPNIDSINQFLFYMMTKHFVKADDIDSIEKRLQQAIDDYVTMEK